MEIAFPTTSQTAAPIASQPSFLELPAGRPAVCCELAGREVPNVNERQSEERGIFTALLGDGRFLILTTGLALVLAGGFVTLQAATGHFLPHDVDYLGMTASELCGLDECRIVHFMIHDRVSFGSVLVTIGILYMWLAEFPLRAREPWAWCALAASGAAGFASFLSYLGFGYLDQWHGTATLLLIPCFVMGMIRSRSTSAWPRGAWLLPMRARHFDLRASLGWGQLLLLVACLGITGAGIAIMTIGMTSVFVPQDLEYLGLSVEALQLISPRLIPLIAHDRAGFGGGLCSAGIVLACIVWCASPSRPLWQILALAGAIGFTGAIAIHFVIGYDDIVHLGPACLGAIVYALGLALTYRGMHRR